MATDWYYSNSGRKRGPVTSSQLKALARTGKLLPTDLVWKDGMSSWQPASKVKGLFPTAPPSIVLVSPVRPAPPISATERRAKIVGGVAFVVLVVAIVGAVLSKHQTSGSFPFGSTARGLSAAEAKEQLLGTAAEYDGLNWITVQNFIQSVEIGYMPIAMADKAMCEYGSETQAAYRVWRNAYVAEKK
jgi:hypothetical protein